MKLALLMWFSPQTCNLAKRYHDPTLQMTKLSLLSIWSTCTGHPLNLKHLQVLGIPNKIRHSLLKEHGRVMRARIAHRLQASCKVLGVRGAVPMAHSQGCRMTFKS